MMKTRMLFSTIAVIALILAGLANPSPARANIPIHYAAPGSLTSGTCDTWGAACELRYLLTVPSVVSGDEVWVKAGVYKPAIAGGRGASFSIPPGVRMYGGFVGTESARTGRNWVTNVTVLSGDIDSNDYNLDGNNIAETYAEILGSNSYHVVKIIGTGTPVTDTTVLDGFVITGGQANGTEQDSEAGGLRCTGGAAGGICSPTLSNLTFSGNMAGYGGAVFADGTNTGTSSPTFTDVTFTGNRATGGWGGGIYVAAFNGGISSPTFTNVTFSGNSAQLYGGAMANDGRDGTAQPRLTNVTFFANSAYAGGAIYNTGENGISSPVIINSTFSDNGATWGGAIYNYVGGTSGQAQPLIINTILWDDSLLGLSGQGREVYNDNAAAQIYYSVVEGGCASISGATCGADLETNPNLSALDNNGGFTKTMALGSGSSAIDAAYDPLCPRDDQRGVIRPAGPKCDIGAYEFNGPITISGTLNATGGGILALANVGYVDGVPKSVVSDGSGHYSLSVPYGWSGTVTPYDTSHGFSPTHRTYEDVLADQSAQDFTGSSLPASGVWDDGESAWVYAGGWGSISALGAYGDSLHVVVSPGSTATFVLYGRGFALTYARFPGGGGIEVYLDGVTTPLTTINSAGTAGLPTYYSPGLIPGVHTVMLKHAGPAGSFVAIDALQVLTVPTVAPAKHDVNESWLSPTGAWANVPVTGLYLDSLQIALTPGSTTTLAFVGSSFTLTYLQYANWGDVALFLDGNTTPLTVIDSNGPAAVETYTSPPLTPTLHILTIYHAGTAGQYIGIDALETFP